MQVVSYTDLRKNMKNILDKIVNNHEPTILTRQKEEPMVIMSLSDFNSLEETAYLMRNNNNYKHIDDSIKEYKNHRVLFKKLED